MGSALYDAPARDGYLSGFQHRRRSHSHEAGRSPAFEHASRLDKFADQLVLGVVGFSHELALGDDILSHGRVLGNDVFSDGRVLGDDVFSDGRVLGDDG